MDKPKYNEATGAAIFTGRPPFDFEGVTMRVFPLKANLERLSRFVNEYLNDLVPPEIAEFRPALPYVLLSMVHYGRMASEVRSAGWICQDEILFSIPLERYVLRNGRLVFCDWISLTPFIYVDNESSQITGREVYGWPKVQGWLDCRVNPWARNPRNDRDLMTMSTRVFPELYAGQRKEPRELLEIVQEATPTVTIFPPSPFNRLNPMLSVPRAMASTLAVFQQTLEMILRPAVRGYDSQSLIDYISQFAQGVEAANVLTRRPRWDYVSLKQFRDAEEPSEICYQAIIKSTSTVGRFNRGGMLGDSDLLLGDPSAGFRVRVHRYAGKPIVESLGLDVDEEYEVGGVRVAVLRPMFPYWVDVDLHYGVGDALAWRTRRSPWFTPSRDPEPEAAEEPARGHPYNNAPGGTTLAVTGPFRFPGAVVRVLPLLADHRRLADFCHAYLNDGERDILHFEALGRYVYLMAWSFGPMSSETNDVGWWAHRRVEMVLPIKWYEKGELASLGWVSPFVFSDSGVATATSREIYGMPALEADLCSPPNHWMARDREQEEIQGLLEVDLPMLPALGVGQRLERARLLEIVEGDVLPPSAVAEWKLVAAEWGSELIHELERKRELGRRREELALGRALSLELFAHGSPFNQISLKQFRDAHDPGRACYQAVVRTPTYLDRVEDLREIEERLHVGVYRSPSQPIVETLGLKVKRRDTTERGVVEWLQPIRPFWLRGDVRTGRAQNLCWRSGSNRWRRDSELPEPLFFQRQEPTNVGNALVSEIEDQQERSGRWAREEKRQHLRAAALEWLEASDESAKLDRGRARTVVDELDPQCIVESVLSREWGHRGEPRWWRRLQGEEIEQKPDFCVRRDSLGAVSDEYFPAESSSGDWYAGGSLPEDRKSGEGSEE